MGGNSTESAACCLNRSGVALLRAGICLPVALRFTIVLEKKTRHINRGHSQYSVGGLPTVL